VVKIQIGRSSGRRSPAVQQADPGYTLVETMITIALLATVVIAMMTAVQASVRVSALSRSAAQVETAIVNAADRINRAPLSCDYTVYAQAAVQTEGWQAEQASVVHEWYDPTAKAWHPDADGCRFATPTLDLVQKVTVSITSPDGQVTRSIQVVKSNV
jgi:type II secretory pathway pseudopilin PulG